MNNSEALQDDNGKLEVRLFVACVCACVCVRLVDSFQPGGNCKRLFIHISYVNKVTLLFKVAKWGRVTGNLAISGRWSNDYRSVVMSTFSPAAIRAISQSHFLGSSAKKEKKALLSSGVSGEATLKGGYSSLHALSSVYIITSIMSHCSPIVVEFFQKDT